jgi:aspartate/methionine/tyrosine aminotransferase
MQDDFYRIKRLPPYVIAEVNAMRAAARARGDDIIDLGMGNPMDIAHPRASPGCAARRAPITTAGSAWILIPKPKLS